LKVEGSKVLATKGPSFLGDTLAPTIEIEADPEENKTFNEN